MKLSQVAVSSALVVAAVRAAPVPTPDVATQAKEDDWLGAAHLARRQLGSVPSLNARDSSSTGASTSELLKRTMFGGSAMNVGGEIATKAAIDSSAHTLAQAAPPPQNFLGDVSHHHCIVS